MGPSLAEASTHQHRQESALELQQLRRALNSSFRCGEASVVQGGRGGDLLPLRATRQSRRRTSMGLTVATTSAAHRARPPTLGQAQQPPPPTSKSPPKPVITHSWPLARLSSRTHTAAAECPSIMIIYLKIHPLEPMLRGMNVIII
jgi:hypothetical protein